MIDEALAAIGDGETSRLLGRAEALEEDLIERSTPGFETFADLVTSAGH